MKHILTTLLGTSLEWEFVRAIVVIFAVAAIWRLIPLRMNGQKRRGKRPNYLAVSAGVLSVAVVLAGAGIYVDRDTSLIRHTSKPQAAIGGTEAKSSSGAVSGTTADPGKPDIGVFEPGSTASYTAVRNFASETGQPARISLYYSGWNDPFQINMANWAYQNDGMPFVQMLPYGRSLASLVNGQYDAYLRSFATAVRGYKHPVLIGFAPEMNGNWYDWGNGHTAPSVYVAAWQHLVNVFRAEHANNVIWVWTVNSINASGAPLKQWWPGASYVTWIGVDGYYYKPSDTFNSVFGTTIQEISTFTNKRVLISETAIGPNSANVSQLNGLFQGVKNDHLLGFVWFDQAQNDPPYHQDWRLADNRALEATFRTDAASI
ncbi:MAG TPA: glycosyl hydrolase [Trebonia sp.]|nr:glycosyl hydrolase [Trebonia sp.]